MAKNLTNFEDFREKKSTNESKIIEASQSQMDSIPIVKMVNFPLALVKSFIKKVLDETGKDIAKGGIWSDDLIARTLVDYATSTSHLMIIENFPVSIATGTEGEQKAQSAQSTQAQIAQPPAQIQSQPPAQTSQGGQGQQIQSPPATSGQPNPQQTAQQIPATEQ